MSNEKKIRKGITVRFNTTIRNDRHGDVYGHRPCTRDEVQAWYASDASKGMNCAGETKLPPMCTGFKLDRKGSYTVVRARCRVRLGYGNPQPGMSCIHDPVSGEDIFVPRRYLEAV